VRCAWRVFATATANQSVRLGSGVLRALRRRPLPHPLAGPVGRRSSADVHARSRVCGATCTRARHTAAPKGEASGRRGGAFAGPPADAFGRAAPRGRCRVRPLSEAPRREAKARSEFGRARGGFRHARHGSGCGVRPEDPAPEHRLGAQPPRKRPPLDLKGERQASPSRVASAETAALRALKGSARGGPRRVVARRAPRGHVLALPRGPGPRAKGIPWASSRRRSGRRCARARSGS
jgi:hypothetical protein